MAFIGSKKNGTQGNKASTVGKPDAVGGPNLAKTRDDSTTTTAPDLGAVTQREEGTTSDGSLGLRGGDGGAGAPGAYCLIV